MSGNTPLRFLGVGNMLDREYRNSPAYQWARELARNGIEAHASTIRFGVEWQGVEATGVHRMQYADDGDGMSREQLRDYMVTLGKGSKIVGGPHDNYALGSRMTLLPWNPEGVVVISLVDGDAQMVKMKFDADAADGEGEYVLEEVAWIDGDKEGLSTVYPPYVDEELGVDWLLAIPEFITKAGHGTTFIMLGRTPNDDTLNGDSDRKESIRYLTRKYFNARFWDLPEGVTLRCIEFVKPDDRAAWPKSESDREAYQYRGVRGAKSIVEYAKSNGENNVESSGVLTLSDGTKANWWLRKDTSVDTGGVGSSSGFIGVLYRGELYGHAYANSDDAEGRNGTSIYRQFGIGSDVVRKRVFIILEPSEYDEVTGAPGVAPSTGRADLYWMGAGLSPRSVKPADWSEEFAEKMPSEIEAAVNAAHEESRKSDEDRDERMKRIMDRFKKRWNAPRARKTEDGGDTTTAPTGSGAVPRTPIDSPTPTRRPRKGQKRVVVRTGPSNGPTNLGQPGTGTDAAKSVNVAVGLPGSLFVTADDLDDAGMIAAWQKPSKVYPNGCIEIDEGHPVITGQIEYWQAQYPKAHANAIADIVKDAYSEVAIAKVSHMFALTGSVLSEEQRDEMLLNPALTTSMLGLISEDALISPRLGGLGAKRKHVEIENDLDDLSEAAEPMSAD